jgi:hypothetical protein
LVRAASQKLSGHGCPAIKIRQSEIFAEAQRATLGRASDDARTRLGRTRVRLGGEDEDTDNLLFL